MPDIPGNASTTTVITVDGAPINDVLESNGDHDWVRIELVAGQKITISVDGITLEDSLVSIRNSAGVLLAENDDISSGVVRDSRLVFTATSSGTYYIDVGAFNNAYSGTYQLSVVTWTPPPVADYATIATHLTHGYWGGESHHFAATQGGSISVNLTALTASGVTLAREALLLWSDIIGITFNEVTTGGQITFDDNESGAFSTSTRSGGITSSAHVNVSTQWLVSNGTSLNSYSFQTYIHEIGHALGLGHGGFYNSTATYADDALFANDGWPTTIMSYFDQQDNSYFANLGFTYDLVSTPMIADIRGMATLYGLSTTTRTGDTTYGFVNSSGRSVYTAFEGTVSTYTVFDSGGIDTLNYSGYSANQVINLTSETFSNVGGGIGNVSIAFGTLIENAVGGSGNDTLTGNSADNVLNGNFGNDVLNGQDGNDTLIGGFGIDTLTSGAGADIISDTASSLSGDTITDFASGDRIVFTDATLAGFTFNLTGSNLVYTGGSLTLTGGVSGTLVASAAVGGGVQLAIQAVVGPIADVRNDFNGDGRSDILWRNVDGQLSNWLGTATGGFVQNNANAAAVVPVAWQVVGTGDFNGDGRDDILWRNSDGTVSNWLGTATGGFTPNDAIAARFVPTSWFVVGTGDFNGDGRDDILWRNTNGQISNWLGQTNGGFVLNDAIALTNVDTAWHVVGTGDFNGDGRDDILWRNDNGQLSNWLGQANGGFINNGAIAGTFVPLAWSVVAVGDYNGDGRDDILWRNTNGTVTDWLGNANGSFTPNDANAAAVVPVSWEVQPEAFFL